MKKYFCEFCYLNVFDIFYIVVFVGKCFWVFYYYARKCFWVFCCAWQEFHLAPTYLQVRWRNQSYVVLAAREMFLCLLVALGDKFS